jgi:hypothetical protein
VYVRPMKLSADGRMMSIAKPQTLPIVFADADGIVGTKLNGQLGSAWQLPLPPMLQ